MSKSYSNLKQILIIVESPSKCKKIQEYLGDRYKVVASYGHLRSLDSLNDIKFTDKLELSFNIIKNVMKKKQIANIKKEIADSSEVILASDSDREGEAIAWHLCELFRLNPQTCKRIVFNEITKNAIQNAVKNPRTINMSLVESQQSRQVLDLLVGFKISPILWKHLTFNKQNALSAGRCQTPALNLIYENHLKIQNSIPKVSYNTNALFGKSNYKFELDYHFISEEEANSFMKLYQEASVKSMNHKFEMQDEKVEKKGAPDPLITSKLQQIANNDLRLSPKDTMKICQTLYESGYITYMRTDCKKYSKDFLEEIKEYIKNTYVQGDFIKSNLLSLSNETISSSEKPKAKSKTSTKNKKDENKTQDAHEAIRPTNIKLLDLPEKFSSKEKKLYGIIHRITLESCMNDAKVTTMKVIIPSYAKEGYNFINKFERIHCINDWGWLIVSKVLNNTSIYLTKEKEFNMFKTYANSSNEIQMNYLESLLSFTGETLHYTESKLVNKLEEKGIGRPSTYAMLVEKIQERGYVKKQDVEGKKLSGINFYLKTKNAKSTQFELSTNNIEKDVGKEKGKLVIQPIGELVIKFLNQHFSDLFNYDFTKNMENDLDEIAANKVTSLEICKNCDYLLNKLITSLPSSQKENIILDEQHKIIVGRYGPVIETKNDEGKKIYKGIKKGITLEDIKEKSLTLNEIQEEGVKKDNKLGEKDGKSIEIFNGKFGLYVKYDNKSYSLSSLHKKNIDDVTLEEVISIIDKPSNIKRELSKNATIRLGPKGDYIFYKNEKMKKPKFIDIKKYTGDYMEDDIIDIFNWVNTIHKINIQD